MGYQVVRTQKLKSSIEVKRSLDHAFRAVETPNADPSRLPDNTHIGAETVDAVLKKFRSRLATQKSIRKNGVLAIEYLVTGSHEDLIGKTRADQDAYFEDSLSYLKNKHGPENVIYAGIHRDETTPHLYAFIVPLDSKGKLNCRAFLGGPQALSILQTDFHNEVSKKHGLDRGIAGSKARHIPIRKFYSQIVEAFEPLPEVTTPKPKRRPESEKPGFFASTKEKEDWNRTQVEADAQDKQRWIEIKDQRKVAIKVALRHQAQAALAKLLSDEVIQLKKSNGIFVNALTELKTQNARLTSVVGLFTQEEIQDAHDRKLRHDAEKAREAEFARSEVAVAAEKAARLDRVASEFAKRIEGIQQLLKQGGAEYTFGLLAANALQEAVQNASLVNWAEIEDKAIRAAIAKNGQSAENVTQVILKNSPGRANPDTHAALIASINRERAELEEKFQLDRGQQSEKDYLPI